MELKKQREQEKKRNEPQFERLKGRKDMQKVLIEKKVKKKKEVDLKVDNDEEMYLNGDNEEEEVPGNWSKLYIINKDYLNKSWNDNICWYILNYLKTNE